MRRILVLAAMLVLALALSAQAAQRLTYASFFPPTHVQSKLAKQWCAEVEKRTDGEVAVDYFPGGTLVKAAQTFDGVVHGMADVGFSVLAYSRGRFPVMAAVDLPLGYPSGEAATEVANAVYDEFQPKAFDQVKVMYFHAHGPGLLHTKGGKVDELADMKGLKLRATGNSARLVEALGGTPVAMSMPDSYQAIQKGVVDGGMYPVETNKGWNMAEVVDYMTESHPVAYTTTFFVVMNKARWQSISEKNRQAIEAINREWADKHATAWDESDAEGMEFFKAQGGEVVPLKAGQAETWKAAAEPMLENYVREADSKGVDGRAVLEFTRKSLTEAKGE
ncbi:TRAP transporter substrate-binding protein [Desulfohalovibrio reitneri]|uniref:TRAP transporter substrate-binding protein n=1 Tax=Desulfohalovibrio reitneri TaxID=1307759 RepID=UPI0004A733C5|nr:TRAP transporter substrate-binding protein [Desulfohalovibrio reitneri]